MERYLRNICLPNPVMNQSVIHKVPVVRSRKEMHLENLEDASQYSIPQSLWYLDDWVLRTERDIFCSLCYTTKVLYSRLMVLLGSYFIGWLLRQS
jgi:hypothetical protein